MKTSLAAWCTVLLLSAACVPHAKGQVRVHYPDRAYSTLSYAGSQWIASPRGLYRYRFDDKVWSAYGPQNGLLSAEVTSLDVRNDVLWIGQRGGITSFDLRSNTMLHYDSTLGFSAGAVRTTAFEEDYVWTGGSQGAARYDNLIEEWQRVAESEGLTGTAVDQMEVALPVELDVRVRARRADRLQLGGSRARDQKHYHRNEDPAPAARETSPIRMQSMHDHAVLQCVSPFRPLGGSCVPEGNECPRVSRPGGDQPPQETCSHIPWLVR